MAFQAPARPIGHEFAIFRDLRRRYIARAGGHLSSSIMVGDAGPDIGVARRAGIPVIGVEFGYTEVPIAELKPDRSIGHMKELPAAVEELMSSRAAKPLIH